MKISTSIILHKLELNLYLGWPDAERAQRQVVLVDLKIQFLEPPRACETDDLTNTFCYAELTTVIQQITTKPVHLLEYLGREIYQVTKQFLKNTAQVSIRVTKKPPIANLKSATFCYGDEDCTW